MRYTSEAIIFLPRSKVIELFDDPDNMYYWHEGLDKLNLLNGIQRQEGAKSKLIYKLWNYKFEVIETIESRSLPDELICTYESKNIWKRVKSLFIEIDMNRTILVLITEFRCAGFLKILSFLAPNLFRKMLHKDIQEFKQFAESKVINNLYNLCPVRKECSA